MRSTLFVIAVLLSVVTVGNNSFARESLRASDIGSKSEFQNFGLNFKLSDYSKQDDCAHLRLALQQRQDLLSEFYYLAHQPPERLTEEDRMFLDMVDPVAVIQSISELRQMLRDKGC